MKSGLYIHMPFCEKKCEYCDFYSITQLDQMDNFVHSLQKEMEIRASDYANHTFQTIYFGGGTPSLLNENQMILIWDSLRTNFKFCDQPEVSIEANPGTLTRAKLAFLKDLGFNRLSLGAQSFNPNELMFLGRIHSVDDIYQSFHIAREVGFANINVDLITAFPSITLQSFYRSLRETIRLGPEHISCYTLIFEPGTGFYKKMQQGKLKPLEDDREASYYKMASDTLEAEGYLHYEISNFSRGQEHICQHNQIYWNHHPYLGLGPSAHSFLNNQRQANKRSLAIYINDLAKGQLPIGFQEDLTDEDLMFEYIFLNLRMRDGIDLTDFQSRFGIDYGDKFSTKIQYLSDNNFIEMDGHHLRLSERGWMLADSISTYF